MNKVKEYLLDNPELIGDLVKELNSWDGSFDNLDFYHNDEDFFNTFFKGRPEEAVRAVCYGEYDYMDDYVRFNGYGNLESFTEYQLHKKLKDYVDEVIEAVIEKRNKISIYDDDLEELLDSLEDSED